MKITRTQLRRLILKEASYLNEYQRLPNPGDGSLKLKGNGPHEVRLPLAFKYLKIVGKPHELDGVGNRPIITVSIKDDQSDTGYVNIRPAEVVILKKEELIPQLKQGKGILTFKFETTGSPEYKLFLTR